MLIADTQKHEDKEIPDAFWWAEGNAALEQDWASGDFSTWIDEKYEVKAFGVTFGLSGVLQLIDFTQRPLVARRLSVAGDPEWITAKQALRDVIDAEVCLPDNFGSYILQQAQLGFVAARAVQMKMIDKPSGSPVPFKEAREWDLPDWYWLNHAGKAGASLSWDLGRFLTGGAGPVLIELNGVHFHADSVRAITGKVAEAEAQAKGGEVNGSPGGRKRKYDWEDGSNAIWGAIYRGELIPKNQAYIEKALQAHFRRGDNEPSESTVRPYASRIWSEYSKEAEN